MTAIRREVLEYINELPDSKLEALAQGREEYKKGSVVSLDSITS